MASTDLLFAGEPLDRGDLVFGDDGSNPITDATISGTITLARPSIHGTVKLAIMVQGSIALARPTLTGQVNYVSDTQRPLTSQATVRWQDVDVLPEIAVQQRHQDAIKLPAHVAAPFENAAPLPVGVSTTWQEANRQQRQWTRDHFQDGVPMRTGVRQKFQQAIRTPRPVRQRFENAAPMQQGFEARFRDGVKTANQQHVRYQDAVALHVGVQTNDGFGVKLQRGWSTRYQEGIQPRPGRTILVPVIPPVDPCYVPNSNLVFEMPWSADTNLVFVCEAHVPPQPGATIIVPVKKVYIVLNTASLRRVDGDVPIPTYSMSMSLDVDSWTWSFSAAIPGRALADISPDGDGNRALLEATINGAPYRFLVTSRGRDRSFASDGLRISGKGIGAELADPIASIMSFGNTGDRTAQQLMGDVLSLNGVPLPDWTVDWQIENWLVKAGAWKKQGTYIEALNEIVAAAGGYLQPHPTAKTLRALLRYPTAPWNWGDVTPDYELPTAAFTNEGTEWVEKPVYDRVYVSGQAGGGRLTNVRREGTAGENVAQMVTESLNTDSIAGRQRGQAILSDTGKITTYTLRGAAGLKDVDGVPVGIIPPGKFVRYVDPDEAVPRLGITRSVAVDVRMPEIWQTITVETHEDV